MNEQACEPDESTSAGISEAAPSHPSTGIPDNVNEQACNNVESASAGIPAQRSGFGIPGFQQYEQSVTRNAYCVTHNNWYPEHVCCEYCGTGYDFVHFRGDNYGFEENACTNGIHGMFPDSCDACAVVVEATTADFAARPLHVVLTGTFPQLGGGSGLKVGKEKLQKLVESTAHGKVVSALSLKCTHMVTGENPGAVKVQQSAMFGYMKVVTYDEFLPIINEKLRNPPVLETKKQKQQKKRAAADVAADVERSSQQRLRKEQDFMAQVEAATAVLNAAVSPTAAAIGATPSVIPVSATAPATASVVTLFNSRSQGVNYTDIHLLYFKRCSWQLIECGGGGNCFFYSVAAINKIYGNRRADLYKSHLALRKQICDFWKSNLDRLNLGGMKMADFPGIHQKIVKYAKPNEYVEYEVVAAFSSMIEEPVIVWNVHSNLPCVMFPDGRLLRESEVLPDTPWRLWADGGHYQAAVHVAMFTMRAGKPLTDVVNIKDIVCNE